ncbi:MAG: ABC transporter ATP-binding protein [Actinomycetota bacterium]|nr:ABC transporter ATP-binding protein [Actinomycetota bacterium]
MSDQAHDAKVTTLRSDELRGVQVRLEGVNKRYVTGSGTITALGDVGLAIPSGAIVGLTGPSGSGKSTLLHVVGAMDVPDSGRIDVGGVEVTTLDRRAQSEYRRTIGFVFQRFHLLPALTVLDNVAAPVLPFKTAFDKSERAAELLAAVGLGGREDALPSQLSGGEQQRVAIARALINDPGLLLADEPTGNLDSATGTEIMQLLLDLRRSRGMTVLVATHNALIAARCDRIVRLLDGRVLDDVEVTAGTDPDALLQRIGRVDV